MKRMICFDMDGTIADLYNVPHWLDSLHNEDASPYENAAPMWDMNKLNATLDLLRLAGWEIRVITWLSKDSSESYKEKVRAAKLAWIEKWGFKVDHFHAVQYGATKADSVRRVLNGGEAILIDDNAKVRAGWNLGMTIDPQKENLIEKLENLLTAA